MKLFRPLPVRLTRVASILTLTAWAGVMGLLVYRSYVKASAANLATDLSLYGAEAQWRGIYYRGEKIGYVVSQTVATRGGREADAGNDGYELQEDGRIQMSLLGADTVAVLKTRSRARRRRDRE